MSDTEIIVRLIQSARRRLRARQLLSESTFCVSIVLLFLSLLKILDLLSPFDTRTVTLIIIAGILFFAGYLASRLRKTETLEDTAASIDRRAGMNDEIRTAFWFIRNPRSSEWINGQLQRAAHSARKIDVRRIYPDLIPRSSFPAAAMLLIFLGLNFVPQAAPEPARTAADSQAGDPRIETILAAVDQIAADFRESEKLREVAEALSERRFDAAAEELRKLSAQLGTLSPESLADIQQTVQKAAGNSRPGLEPLTEDLVDMAAALRNTDVTTEQAAFDQVAADFEGLDEEIYRQESERDQLFPGNERRAEQDGHVPGVPIPDTRDFPQTQSGADGMGASGGNAEAGPRQGQATTLAVKLEEEALKGMPNPAISRVEVEEASREERSRLDYRNVASELTPAQRDVLNHTNVPWKYRTLIKDYFEAVLQPAKK
jgi:hypothetical protein